MSELKLLKTLVSEEPKIESCKMYAEFPNEFAAAFAKKNWMLVLEERFILERDYDYKITVVDNYVEVNFLSACGRYAFWRLENQDNGALKELNYNRICGERTETVI